MAPRRQVVMAQSVQYSIVHGEKRPTFLGKIPAYFYTYWLTFACVGEDLFKALRGTWQISQDDYLASFHGKDALVPMGDVGYSGSTFFRSKDGRYVVKSIPRHFEHSFFKHDLLLSYAEYMQSNPASLMIRITDFLECIQSSFGAILGLAPSHHIVMENTLYGQEEAGWEGKKWETYDLKPMSYFYPERDVASGALASEATKSKLADNFPEKLVLTLHQAEDFKGQLEKDSKFLADHDAVDYSLFLVRIPLDNAKSPGEVPEPPDGPPLPPEQAPFVPPSPPSWRTGVTSADGQYAYRAAILDFFWAKHKVHAMAMTGLINAYNAVDRKGPMSVTTEPHEYRKRFLRMCSEIIEVKERSNNA